MSLPWFRFYTEFLTDAKITLLAFEDQRHYVAALCLKGKGVLDADYPNESYRERIIAKYLGLDPVSAAEAKRRLMEPGLVDSAWHPIKWDARQFASDSSSDRVKRFRDKKKGGNGDETLQKRKSNGLDTEIDTDLDTDSEKTNTQGARLKSESTPSETDPPASHTPALVLVPRDTFHDSGHEWFLEFKLAMPDRAGDPNWSGAKRAANARIREGYTPTQFINGARRYKAYCDATDSTATQYVKTASAFLGPDKHFLKDWDPPKNKAERRLTSNLSAAEEFMRRTETTV